MQYIRTLSSFLIENDNDILNTLIKAYPDAEKSQIESWKVLVTDLKTSTLNQLPGNAIISIEFSLPLDGLAIDALIVGTDSNNQKHAFLIESKQWVDANIYSFQFGESRSEELTLHPQIQVSRQALGLKDYTNVGELYEVHPIVFMRNATSRGIDELLRKNPIEATAKVPIFNSLEKLVNYISMSIKFGCDGSIYELDNAIFKPSKSIISAMESIGTRHDPFILTKEQEDVVSQTLEALSNGKKIVRITGAAGSGKTAILLHVYIKLLNMFNDDIRPIFISGAQNTKLYKSMFSHVERSFTFSYSLKNMVGKTVGHKYYICMDEAQHNEEGIITQMIDRGAHLLLCYDSGQIINANNSLRELEELDKRSDFISITLKNSVRFSGSQVFERNARKLLDGDMEFEKDENFDFRVFDTIDELINHTKKIINDNPNRTVAVTGLLSKDAKQIAERQGSQIFINWGYLGETKWMPYIEGKHYLEQNNGKLWVGTWWLPGLDVDYISVIVGGDAKFTDSGLKVDLDGVMQYKMMYSVAEKLGLPRDLFISKKSFGKEVIDNKITSSNIFKYIDKHPEIRDSFISLFTELIKNNYYILLTRGRKGCYVCFSNK